jgi:hypothetical protein
MKFYSSCELLAASPGSPLRDCKVDLMDKQAVQECGMLRMDGLYDEVSISQLPFAEIIEEPRVDEQREVS